MNARNEFSLYEKPSAPFLSSYPSLSSSPPSPSPPPYASIELFYPNLIEIESSGIDIVVNKVVILVPGIGGSSIYCNCGNLKKKRKLYPSKLPGVINLNGHFFSCRNTTTKILKSVYGISVYKNFLFRTKAIAFPYDWRLSPIIHARALLAHILQYYPSYQITLVGHSLGGLIIRILIEYLKPFELLDYLADVYICGTPFYGSFDTNDYNCELQIVSVLTKNKKQIKLQHKPMILTSNDIKNIFKHFGITLLYLAPSFIIRDLELKIFSYSNNNSYLYSKENVEELELIKYIHNALSAYNFQRINYHIFFNVSRKIDVVHIMDTNLIKHISRVDGETHIKSMKKLTQDQWEVVRSFNSDGLVLSCRKLPNNATTFFDQTLATHALLMNSKNLTNLILQKI